MQKGLYQSQTTHGSAFVGPGAVVRQTPNANHARSGERKNANEFLDCLDMVDDVLLARMIETLELESLQTLPDLSQFFRRNRRQYHHHQLASARRVLPSGNWQTVSRGERA